MTSKNISGIGRGIAIELWKAGAKVVAVSRTQSHLDSLHAQYPSIDVVALDVGDYDKTRQVIDDLGHFDALVNNAAIANCQPFLECSPDVFDR